MATTTFSYWEKRRKNFGKYGPYRDDQKPFGYQSYPQGVTVVRYADGTISPVSVVDEELEALEGIRIYYGGKNNTITPTEVAELTTAGYGDYISTSGTPGGGSDTRGYGQGAYGAGPYGTP